MNRRFVRGRLQRVAVGVLALLLIVPAGFASPVMAADPVTCATPAAISGTGRAAVETGLTTLVKAIAACETAGDWQAYSTLVTEKYLEDTYGGGNPLSRADFMSVTAGLPVVPVRFRSFDDLKIIRAGEARANVKLVIANQLIFEQWNFREESGHPGAWLLDSSIPLTPEPPRQHDDLDLTISGNAYSPATLTAAQANIRVRISNSDNTDHEVLLLGLATGTTIGTLLLTAGPGLPPGFTYMAQLTVPAKAKGTLVLVNIKPGTYAMVDLLPDVSGV